MGNYEPKLIKQMIGRLVAEKRNAMRLSQEALAEKLGIHTRTLSKIENGHTFFSAETLCKFCEFFNLQPKAFFDFGTSTEVNEQKLNMLTETLRNGGNDKIDFYFDVVNLIDTKYNG